MGHFMAVILAAGEGKRMKSKKAKVLHEICGVPLVDWVYRCVKSSGVADTVLVVGHKADDVKEYMKDKVFYALQKEQLGTGHAVMQAEEFLKNKDGNVLVLCGDTPLITSETIQNTIKHHNENGNSATVITADLDNPSGYGRIVRDGSGNVQKIVEHKDASLEERNIREINSGMYCFNIPSLVEALKELDNNNSQGEYYLTDTLEILIKKGMRVGAVKVGDENEILGINDRVQLSQATRIIRERILDRLMRSGVTLIDPATTYIDQDVQIGMDTIIYPSTIIEGITTIGEDCVIGPGSRITDSRLADMVEVENSVVTGSSISKGSKVGPFACLGPGSNV
ncbi:MAG: bifunctional UDP-N-acetylglucosamine diphosphorylase/glucosamine-1-phosphate N-acetyltransferase GlmU [Clostridiaceae bacterium]|nr:bifunctional UDP-N-acetylglucosamine diphosphorylase/glucosamine-1-phosphate N-acetyltransferase GlmU [Clostridiaceae bacterium]